SNLTTRWGAVRTLASTSPVRQCCVTICWIRAEYSPKRDPRVVLAPVPIRPAPDTSENIGFETAGACCDLILFGSSSSNDLKCFGCDGSTLARSCFAFLLLSATAFLGGGGSFFTLSCLAGSCGTCDC